MNKFFDEELVASQVKLSNLDIVAVLNWHKNKLRLENLNIIKNLRTSLAKRIFNRNKRVRVQKTEKIKEELTRRIKELEEKNIKNIQKEKLKFLEASLEFVSAWTHETLSEYYTDKPEKFLELIIKQLKELNLGTEDITFEVNPIFFEKLRKVSFLNKKFNICEELGISELKIVTTNGAIIFNFNQEIDDAKYSFKERAKTF